MDISSRLDFPQVYPGILNELGHPVVIVLSVTRVVVAFPLVGPAGESDSLLRLILFSELGDQVAQTDLDWIISGGGGDLDSNLPTPMMARVDDTHLLEVLTGQELTPTVVSRRIAVADDGFTVDYTTSDALPSNTFVGYGYAGARLPSLLAVPEFELMVIFGHGYAGPSSFIAIDTATGLVAWASTETLPFPTSVELFVDADKLTIYYYDAGSLSRSWTLTATTVTVVGDAVSLTPPDAVGSHVNPFTAGESDVLAGHDDPLVISSYSSASDTPTVALTSVASLLPGFDSYDVGLTYSAGAFTVLLVGHAELAALLGGVIAQVEIPDRVEEGFEGLGCGDSGLGAYAMVRGTIYDSEPIVRLWVFNVSNDPDLTGSMLGAAVYFT